MGATTPAEGVIRFQAEHRSGAAPPPRAHRTLLRGRELLVDLGALGREPDRYDGYAFGNVSVRADEGGFWISGVQTSGIPQPEAEHFTRVLRWAIAGNRVWSRGPMQPSSESMTHAALYDRDPRIAIVLHGHSPTVWARPDLPRTDAAIEYGTPAMAHALAALAPAPRGIVNMGGHEDGFVVYGETLRDCGAELETRGIALASPRL